MIPLKAYRRDQRGASAVEFALVIPVMMMLVLGVLHMSFVIYASVNLHNATEWTARCLAVSANNPATATTPCTKSAPTQAQLQSYVQARYLGPDISPFTFTVTANGCQGASQLTSSGTYNMALGFASLPITVTAKACYPH